MVREVGINGAIGTLPTEAKRISWGAVFAGIVVTLALQLLLGILGLAIGANSINPLQEQNPASGLGTGTVIWFAVSTLLALFTGGWVAGRLAGMPQRLDSLLHGLLTWGLTALVTFYLLTTTVGGLISGAAGVLGQGMALLGQGATAAATNVAGAVDSELRQRGVDLSDIQREAKTLLSQTGKPALQPENLKSKGEAAVNAAQNTAEDAARNPQASDDELTSLLNRIAQSGEKTLQAADSEALVNVLVARGMDRQEATNTVARWGTTYEQAVVKYQQLKDQAAQQARETGAATAETVSKAALWTFVMLVLGAIAAIFGGMSGAPRDMRETTTGSVV